MFFYKNLIYFVNFQQNALAKNRENNSIFLDLNFDKLIVFIGIQLFK